MTTTCLARLFVLLSLGEDVYFSGMEPGAAGDGTLTPADETGHETTRENTADDRSDAAQPTSRSKGKRPRRNHSNSNARSQEDATENPGISRFPVL
jgi:hypothetical protein